MDDWLARFAAGLASGLGEGTPPADLGVGGEEAVLDLARRVAHGTERRNAPLATFLAGCFVGLRVAQGIPAATAFDEALRLASRLLPDDPA